MNGPNSISMKDDSDDIDDDMDPSKSMTKRSLIVISNSIPDVHLQLDNDTKVEANNKFQFETGV